MRLISMLVFVGSTVSISACGGGSNEQTPTPSPAASQAQPSTVQPTMFVPPNDAASLQNVLYTRYASSTDFDVWQCARPESSTPEFALSFPVAGTYGDGLIAKEYALATGGEAFYLWQTLDGTTLRTTSLDGATVTDTANYQFVSENRVSFEFNGSAFNCDRVDNTVAFGGAPSMPVDNGEGTTLAAENAKIPSSSQPVSAISVSTFDPVFFVNDADMVMAFPNGLQTSCVDWNLVNDQPRDCDRNFDITDVSELKPFSAGQTINNTFGVLTTSGYTSNQLILTSSGEISIGIGMTSIYGVESRPEDGMIKGRYYINGYTITMEFSGSIHHTFIGIQEEKNGDVVSMFLANRYYSVNL